jgi:DNA-binding NarL/FixJ family response regulator
MKTTETTQVLIAEDDALLNDGIARQLSRLGYPTADQAYDGAQAVALACERHPTIILMDLQMTDTDTGREDKRAGLKATQAIQQQCPTAVIVLTAHESPDLVLQAAEAGVCGYLVKPAADQELNRAIMIARARFEELLQLRHRSLDQGKHNDRLQAALASARRLSGLLSVCSWCKKVQAEQGEWQEIEVYVREHSEARFSHGICPVCYKNMLPSRNHGGDR